MNKRILGRRTKDQSAKVNRILMQQSVAPMACTIGVLEYVLKKTNSPTQRGVGKFYACQVSWSAAEFGTEEERHAETLLRAGAASWRAVMER